MRKLFFVLLSFVFFSMLSSMDLMAVSKNKLKTFFNEVKTYEGVEVVRIGSMGTTLLKSLFKMGEFVDGDESREIMKVINGVKKFAILDYDDCREEDKTYIASKINRLLKGSELLMEVKDGDDTMKMYGVVDEEGSSVRDFVLYDSDSCALICFFGTISMDAVMELAE